MDRNDMSFDTTVTFVVPEATAELIRHLADQTGLTPDEVVAHAVRRWANDHPPITSEQFRAILAKAPDVPPVPGDEIE